MLDQRGDGVVIEPVPEVVGGPECEVDVAAGLGIVLVVLKHLHPFLVVVPFRDPPAAMHRDDQRPAVLRLRAEVPPEVGAGPVPGRDRLCLELLAQG